MRDFITGLQFLTTIRLWSETEWTPAGFGRSVRYFALVGAIIGLVQALLGQLFIAILPIHVTAAGLVISGIFLTGGLHCDGFMDSADGLLSGRPRDKMLEIMKDSRVGANGVIAFVALVLVKWSLFIDFPKSVFITALFIAPIAGRVAMVAALTRFPYARPEGIGKAFAQYSSGKSFMFAVVSGVCLIALGGLLMLGAALFSILLGYLVAFVASKRLGGLTGDVYGAVTELTELSFYFLVLVFVKFFIQ